MPPSELWADSTKTLIADTGAVINITASGHAVEIIEAIPNRFIVTAREREDAISCALGISVGACYCGSGSDSAGVPRIRA